MKKAVGANADLSKACTPSTALTATVGQTSAED